MLLDNNFPIDALKNELKHMGYAEDAATYYANLWALEGEAGFVNIYGWDLKARALTDIKEAVNIVLGIVKKA